jgi:hypothetical protein
LSIIQTVLVFVGIPGLVVLSVYALVFATSARRVSKRYRPGRPFTFTPVWFLAGADTTGSPSANGTGAPALGGGHAHGELPAGPVLAQPNGTEVPTQGETGGASDTW